MRLQQVFDLQLDILDQRADLLVDDLRGMFAEIPWLGHFPPQEDVRLAAPVRDRTEPVAHSPKPHHVAGQTGRLLEVITGPGAEFAEHHLFGYPSSQHHADAIAQVAEPQIVPFLFGDLFGGAQGTAMGNDSFVEGIQIRRFLAGFDNPAVSTRRMASSIERSSASTFDRGRYRV